MRKKFKFLTYILGLFILINIFISYAFADVTIPPCGLWENPDKDFCSGPKNILYDINDQEERINNTAPIIYIIAGVLIIIITIISWNILIKIKKNNVK